MAIKHYKKSLAFLVTHAVLGIVWNVVGIWLISQGKPALGPIATYTAIILLTILIIGYFISLKTGNDTIYSFLAIVAFFASFYAIAGSLTKSHSLWSSETWRFTGIFINLFGVIGFIYALITFTKRRKIKV
jgi:hypothetical protein